MSTTPKLPEWIKNIRVEGYRSVYEYCPDETRLFGTESLFGDWNGRVLLLAQDFAPSEVIEERLVEECERPYCHKEGLPTNNRLKPLVKSLGLGSSEFPDSCGVIYGSAFAFMLRANGGGMRNTLPKKSEATRLGAKVLNWAIDNMPNLEVIMCLGNVAWDTASIAIDIPKDRKPFLDSGTPALAQGIHVFAAWHPMASVLKTKTVIPWENAASLLAA